MTMFMHVKLTVIAAGLLAAPLCVAQDSGRQTPAGQWWYRNGDADEAAAAPRANRTDPQWMLATLLHTRLDVDFTEAPLRDVIAYLRNVTGVNLIGRFAGDRRADGMDPEAPITLEVTDGRAIEIVELVLEQCVDDSFEGAGRGCTWQLGRGYIELGTRASLSRQSAMQTRIYDVNDLLHAPRQFDNAPALDLEAALSQSGGTGGGAGGRGGWQGGGGGRGAGGGPIIRGPGEPPAPVEQDELTQQVADLIRELVEPDAWRKSGGESSIRAVNNVIVIRAPDYIQRQIGGYPFAVPPLDRR